jgi:hypothetical protein
MIRDRLRAALAHVGQALRDPEDFTLRWHREGEPYAWEVLAALALTAVAGTLSYGLTLGILGGPGRMAACALSCTTAAGVAWGLPLPGLRRGRLLHKSLEAYLETKYVSFKLRD